MKYCFHFLFLLISFSNVKAQDSRFTLEVNYGLNGNFFVTSYDEISGPQPHTYFYNKNFLGTIGGGELAYRISKKSSIIAGYSRSVNAGKKNFSGLVGNAEVYINDFKIRHYNNFYYAGYKYLLNKKKIEFSIDIGPVLVYSSSQDIIIEGADFIGITESNFKNSNSVEGGLFAGIHLSKSIDKHFELGLKVRGYHLISVASFEALTLTPTLSYKF
jgi:hypothetical protein